MRNARRWIGAGGLLVLGAGWLIGVGLAAGGDAGARMAARWRGGQFVESGPGIRQRTATDCGPASLAHALAQAGRGVAYPDSASALRPGPSGCTLRDLAQEAERLGHPAAVRLRNPERPAAVRRPAVLLLRPVVGWGAGSLGHFVVLEAPAADGGWLVFDPAIGRIRMSGPSLRRHWSGHVLEFTAAGSIPAPGGPEPVDKPSGWSFRSEVLRFPGGGSRRRPVRGSHDLDSGRAVLDLRIPRGNRGGHAQSARLPLFPAEARAGPDPRVLGDRAGGVTVA